MYCSNCGKDINKEAVICPNCGVPTKNYNQIDAVEDNGGFLWGALGFCVPVIGLILFLVWKDTKPKTSKAVGVGALVNIITIVFFYILIVVLGLGTGLLTGLWY